MSTRGDGNLATWLMQARGPVPTERLRAALALSVASDAESLELLRDLTGDKHYGVGCAAAFSLLHRQGSDEMKTLLTQLVPLARVLEVPFEADLAMSKAIEAFTGRGSAHQLVFSLMAGNEEIVHAVAGGLISRFGPPDTERVLQTAAESAKDDAVRRLAAAMAKNRSK